MSERGSAVPGLRVSARQIALLRVLLLTLAVGMLKVGFPESTLAATVSVRQHLAALLIGVGVVTALFAALVTRVNRSWPLAVQLVFDLIWVGLVLYATGGVTSPATALLFAVVLGGLLALPGSVPFVMSALASLVLALNALAYVAGLAPYPKVWMADEGAALVEAPRVLGLLAVQVVGLFLVDGLGQLLTRRISEQRLFTAELLDQLGEGVLAVDRVGYVTYANAEVLRLLGLPDEPVAGRRVDDVLATEHLEQVLELVHRTDCPVLKRFIRPGPRQLVLRLTAITDRRDRVIGRTLLVADETRLLVLEESARRAEHLAALGEMAAGIAHEVRNPLTSLRGCAQELAEINRAQGSTDAANLAAIMVSESDRLARIVEEFLNLSRMRPPNRETIDLEPVFTGLHLLYERRPDAAAVPVSFHIEPDCPLVMGDSDQLRQVLTNLIGNSLDAVRKVAEPRIDVAAMPAPNGTLPLHAVAIRVSDNGVGIPKELQERVFTPFFSTKSQGTGLGLALVSRIVREHEGAMGIDSEPGVGTVISVYLPAHSQTRTFKRALGGE